MGLCGDYPCRPQMIALNFLYVPQHHSVLPPAHPPLVAASSLLISTLELTGERHSPVDRRRRGRHLLEDRYLRQTSWNWKKRPSHSCTHVCNNVCDVIKGANAAPDLVPMPQPGVCCHHLERVAYLRGRWALAGSESEPLGCRLQTGGYICCF